VNSRRFSPLLLTCCTAACFNAAHAQTWDPTPGFTIAANPDGAWQYGWLPASLSGPLTLYTQHSEPPNFPLWGAWIGSDSTPAIWRNMGPSTSYGVAPGQLSMHPGPSGQACVLRWTNPNPSSSGILLINGRFFPGDPGFMRVGVRLNDSLAFEAGNEGEFHLVASNTDTATIDFAVWGGYFFGNTPIEVTITFCPGDFNQDGGVDGSDIENFFAAWESGDAAADVNADGGVDGSDVEAFFAKWESGC
jgi:hypothetical protein